MATPETGDNRGQRSPPLKAQAKTTAPTKLLLRNVQDLTLHGGIGTASRELVVVPIFCGLGTKGVSASAYFRQAEEWWASGHLSEVCKEAGWEPSEMQSLSVIYPALTASLPLPSAAIIDRVLNEQDSATAKVARTQVNRCAQFPRWRRFRVLGEIMDAGVNTVQTLSNAAANNPGLLTDNFQQLLDALYQLHTAIDQAETQQRWVMVEDVELRLACNMSDVSSACVKRTLDSAAWSTIFKNLRTTTLSNAPGIDDSRIKASSMRELRRHLALHGAKWALMPDIGAEAVVRFATLAAAAAGPGKIVDGFEATGPSWSEDDDSIMSLARARKGYALALGFAWRVILERALRRQCYGSVSWSLEVAAPAWSRRFDLSSALATLADQLPTRPIAEGGVILVRGKPVANSESVDSGVRLMPAVPNPQFSAVRPAMREKKFSVVSSRYLSLSAGMQDPLEPGVPGLYVDEAQSLRWPHGRVWQAVDLLKTVAAVPQLWLSPEVLASGELRMSADRWEQVSAELTGDKPWVESPPWPKAYELFLGAAPQAIIPGAARNGDPIYQSRSSYWPISVVDGGLAAADVRLAVRFEPAAAPAGRPDLATCMPMIARLAKQASGRGEAAAEWRALLGDLSESLRFSPRPYFVIDGREVSEEEWFGAVKTKAGYYRLACGLIVDGAVYLARTDQFVLRKRVYAKFQSLGLNEIWRAQQQALGQEAQRLSPEEYLRQLSMQISPVLKQLDEQALGPVADGFLAGELRDLAPILRSYQVSGLAWLYLRLKLGFGVCLADEMGLGKTLQTIALMRILRDRRLPILVVMPKTLIHNWHRELKHFGNGLRTAIYGEESDEGAEVVLISYPRLRLDQESLTKRSWNLVVLDEAQAIKNADTQVAEAANLLQARYRVALTGTPVENRAAELWSIVNWLNPGYLGRQRDFSSYTSMARSSEQKIALLAPLRESLDPLLLRRLKSDPKVALGLPDKVSTDVACELSEEQTLLYEAVVETALSDDNAGLGAFKRRSIFLKAILHLKQICIHPDLFYGDEDDDQLQAELDGAAKTSNVKQLLHQRLCVLRQTAGLEAWLKRSGKMTAFVELMASLQGQSRGILIFTQYLGAADMLRRALSKLSTEPPRFIHGGLSAAARLEMVDEFNEACKRPIVEQACPILILSLKAGGTGLNLTGADRVLHFDRWWNPAVEDQATDRAHRIGQSRTVFVHTLTSEGTIEEAVAQLFTEKRRLTQDLLGAATSQDVGELLINQNGFLDLVDPRRVYSQRLQHGTVGVISQKFKAEQGRIVWNHIQ